MVHGYPDFGVEHGKKTTYQVRDLGELAVRTGSIVNFDRMGDVVLQDDFSSSILKWTTAAAGTGASVALSSVAAKSGSQSCLVTTGNADTNTSIMVRLSHLPVISRLGDEISIALGSDLKYIEILIYAYDGVYANSPKIRYYPQTNTLQYADSAGVFQTITTTLDLFEDDNLFHAFKLVYDLETFKYVRLRINDKTYNLAGIDYYRFANASTPQKQLYLSVINNAAGNHTAYVDDYILTQNEP